MSILRISGELAACLALTTIVVGCGGTTSRVAVEAYGNEMPLKTAVMARGLAGGTGIWACDSNEEAFNPALYSAYPGSRRSWCLYVEKSASRAVFAERDNNSGEYTVFDITTVAFTGQDGVRGKGTASVSRFDAQGHPLSLQAMAKRNLINESNVSFTLKGPIRNGDRPAEADTFVPVMLHVWKNASPSSSPAR